MQLFREPVRAALIVAVTGLVALAPMAAASEGADGGVAVSAAFAAGSAGGTSRAQVAAESPPTTLAERLRWEAEPKGEGYTVNAESLDASPEEVSTQALVANDPVTLDECEQHGSPADGSYWHKNHYSSCLVWSYGGKQLQNNVPISLNLLKIVFIGVGSVNNTPGAAVRRADFTARISAGDKVGENPMPDSTPVTIQFGCDTTGPGNCAVNSTAVTRTMGQWRAGATLSTTVTVTGNGAQTTDPDRKSFHDSFLRFSMTPPPGYVAGSSTTTRDALRCDLARYNYWSGGRYDNGACIFTGVDAFFSFSRASTSAYRLVAEHIYDAQTDVSRTTPGTPGTRILGGRSSGAMLHRLVPSLSPTRLAYYNQNGTTAIATCIRYWGPAYPVDPAGGQRRDCDEYPFRSAYEGAAYDARNGGSTSVSYSARPIALSQNRSAGNALGRWYVNDHILEKDGYWVETRP